MSSPPGAACVKAPPTLCRRQEHPFSVEMDAHGKGLSSFSREARPRRETGHGWRVADGVLRALRYCSEQTDASDSVALPPSAPALTRNVTAREGFWWTERAWSGMMRGGGVEGCTRRRSACPQSSEEVARQGHVRRGVGCRTGLGEGPLAGEQMVDVVRCKEERWEELWSCRIYTSETR